MKSFYEEIAKLKTIQRKGWIDHKVEGRIESDAEHTFSVLMLAIQMMSKNDLKLDELKVLKMVAFHELDEIDVGDATPFDDISFEKRLADQKATMHRLSQEYGMPEIEQLWHEFKFGDSKEAQFVRDLDKYDAIKQAKIYAQTNNNPTIYQDFLEHGKKHVERLEKFDN